jgi:hypothetical protein
MKYPRNNYKWYKTNGFKVGLHGGMMFAGTVKTYSHTRDEWLAMINNILPTLEAPMLPARRARMPRNAMQQEKRAFAFTLAQRPTMDNPMPHTLPVKRTPFRDMSLDGDVKVPFWQAVISGGFTGIAAGIGLGMLDSLMTRLYPHEFWQLLKWYHDVELAGLVWLAVGGVRWNGLLSLNRALLFIEESLQVDINGDGKIGQPIRPRNDGRVIYLERKDSGGDVTSVTHWPLSDDITMSMIYKLEALDHYWSRSRFTGENGTMSQGEWAAANGYMLEHELLTGNRLNEAGVEFFTDLAEQLGEGD